jgi:hypothetical protein
MHKWKSYFVHIPYKVDKDPLHLAAQQKNAGISVGEQTIFRKLKNFDALVKSNYRNHRYI